MTPVPIDHILSSLGLSYSNQSDRYKLLCPFHRDSKASFYIEKENGLYYCFGCGAKGNWYSLIKELTGKNPYVFLGISNQDRKTDKFYRELAIQAYRKANEIRKTKKVEELNEESYQEIKIVGKCDHPYNIQECKDYCKQRHISEEDIETYGIFYTEDAYVGIKRYLKRLVLPIRHRSGQIISYEGRDITKKQEDKCLYPYKSKTGDTVWEHQSLDYNLPIIWAEGVMDVLAIQKVIKDVQCSSYFGIQMTNKQRDIVNRFNRHTLIFDPDEGGDRGIEIFKKNVKSKFLIALLEEFDPGEASPLELLKAYDNKMTYFDYKLQQREELQSRVTNW